MPDSKTIFTVGYSTHEWEVFLSLLVSQGITALADVRSHPTARLEPYRRENLAPRLKAADIEYVFLGSELGARRTEPECYIRGRADYGLIAQSETFRRGLKRLEDGARKYRIALMCAEREPLECHRGVLISRVLTQKGWQVSHLLADGTVEEHSQTEKRLIELVGQDPLFDEGLKSTELLKRAYEERGREIAYYREAPSD